MRYLFQASFFRNDNGQLCARGKVYGKDGTADGAKFKTRAIQSISGKVFTTGKASYTVIGDVPAVPFN
jgi:hypothetical protein